MINLFLQKNKGVNVCVDEIYSVLNVRTKKCSSKTLLREVDPPLTDPMVVARL